MQGTFIHWCIHVLDLEKSLEFYEKALGYTVHHTMGPEDGSWSNTYLVNDQTPFQIELTWNRGRTEPYENGGKDTHIAFTVPGSAQIEGVQGRYYLPFLFPLWFILAPGSVRTPLAEKDYNALVLGTAALILSAAWWSDIYTLFCR